MNPLLQRAKNEVARNYGFKRWDGMLVALRHTEIKLSEDCTDLRNKAQDEAMELYAKYSRKDLQKKVDLFDKELHLVHRCLTDLCDIDHTYPIIKKCLDKIEKLKS